MIRPVFSLARQSLRAALRSRLVAALLMLLGCVTLVLPHTLKGDGTPAGDIRMLLTWTLGFAVCVLAAATLWAGCHALAGEMQEGTFRSLAVTPARRFEICLGKWLGLVVLDAALLLAVMAAVGIQVSLRKTPLRDLRPHHLVRVSEESLREHARFILARATAEGQIPDDDTPEDWFETILEGLRQSHLSIAPGEAHRWRFRLPSRGWRVGDPLRVRLSFTTPIGAAGEIAGTCRVLNAAGEEIAATALDPESRLQFEFPVSSECIGDSPTLALVVENTADAEGIALLVGAADGATLWVPQGTVAGNFLAAAAVLWSVLAALAALGIVAGALFSLPVAVFVASALTLIAALSHADLESRGGGPGHSPAAHHDPAEADASGMERFSGAVLRRIAQLTRTAEDAAPLDRLGDRLRIAPAEAFRSVVSVGLLLPLLAGLGAVLALRHRELP